MSGLCEKLQSQASEGRSDTHHLAIQLSSYQGRIKDTTRKMMAIVSELSMCVCPPTPASPAPGRSSSPFAVISLRFVVTAGTKQRRSNLPKSSRSGSEAQLETASIALIPLMC